MNTYALLENIPAEDVMNSFIIQCSEPPRNFFCFSNVNDLQEFLIGHSSLTRSYWEIGIVTEHDKRALKLFIDFDWEPSERVSIRSNDIWQRYLLPSLMAYFAQKFNLFNLTATDFLFFPMDKQTSPQKISFHVVLDNGHFFKDMRTLEAFMIGFQTFVKEAYPNDQFLNKYIQFIDGAVYRRDDQVEPKSGDKKIFFSLRLPLSSKEGRRKQIPDGFELSDCLVLDYFPETASYFFTDHQSTSTNAEQEPSAIDKKKLIWTPENEAFALNVAKKYLPFDRESLLMVEKFGKTTKMINFKHKPHKIAIWCPICSKQHKSLMPYAYFGSETLTMQCFSNTLRNRGKPKIVIPMMLSCPNEPIEASHILTFTGKVIDFNDSYITLKLPKKYPERLVKIKGSATREMYCPLFQWNVSVKSAALCKEIYQLVKVNSVKLLPLKDDAEWTSDSWKTLQRRSIMNLYSDCKYSTESSIQFYKNNVKSSMNVKEFISRCPERSWKNIWYTEAQLLRLCNEFPDTYRAGVTDLITTELIFEKLLFLNCGELFTDHQKLKWILENITIKPPFKEYIRKSPDFHPLTHEKILTFCDFQQSILLELQGETQGCEVVSRIFTQSEFDEFKLFLMHHNTYLSMCLLPIDVCSKFEVQVPQDPSYCKFVVFYLQRFYDVFQDLIREITKKSNCLIADYSNDDRQPSEPNKTAASCYSFNEEKGHFLFPASFPRKPNMADTITFMNDSKVFGERKKSSLTFNPDHSWSHLKILWSYKTAVETDTLEDWKWDQLQIENVSKHPMWQGSILYIFILV